MCRDTASSAHLPSILSAQASAQQPVEERRGDGQRHDEDRTQTERAKNANGGVLLREISQAAEKSS
jgi:hypothetical protein